MNEVIITCKETGEKRILTDWIVIEVNDQPICAFMETPGISKAWDNILFEAHIRGGEDNGKTLTFKTLNYAFSFINHFCDLLPR